MPCSRQARGHTGTGRCLARARVKSGNWRRSATRCGSSRMANPNGFASLVGRSMVPSGGLTISGQHSGGRSALRARRVSTLWVFRHRTIVTARKRRAVHPPFLFRVLRATNWITRTSRVMTAVW